MQKTLYGIWLIVIILVATIILLLRHRRIKKWKLELNEVFDLAFAILGGISGSYLIYQTYELYDPLYKLVGNEGIAAMCLGGIASVWFAFSKVKELIDKP
jgi:prolipoprotein diacylglyceryltransferase